MSAAAIEALEFWAGLAGDWMPLRLWSERDAADARIWHRVGTHDLAGSVARRDAIYSEEVLLGLPRGKRGVETVAQSSVLWVRVEGREQLAALRAFRPHPSLVLAEGASTRRIAFWPLSGPVPHAECFAANRRLAYALGAVQKHGDPDTLEFGAPGTMLRHGRSRPCAVKVSRLAPAWFTVAGVSGRLKDPPPPDAWKDAVAA